MKSQKNYDHGHLFAFLEQHLLTCSTRDRKRLDVEILRTVSDLVVYFEMLMNVRLHRPLYRARELPETMAAEDRDAWKGWEALDRNLAQSSYNKQRVVGNMLYEKTNSSSLYAVGKTMRLEHSKSMRACLESFWDETRKTVNTFF